MMNYYQLTHGLEEVNSDEEEVEKNDLKNAQNPKDEDVVFRRSNGSKRRGGGGGGEGGEQGVAGLELALGGSLAQDTISDLIRERERNSVKGGGGGVEGADQRVSRGGGGVGGGGGREGGGGVVMRKKSGHPGSGGSIGRRASQRFSRILEGQ